LPLAGRGPQQRRNGFGKRGRVSRRHEPALYALLDALGTPPTRVATTGSWAAIASNSDTGNISDHDASTYTSSAAMTCRMSPR
jgi:hypothetical protein